MRRHKPVRVAVALALLLAHPGLAHAGLQIAFMSPTGGQNYALNAPISYRGSASWDANTPAPVTINVDYMYGNVDATGRILDSEDAAWEARDVTARTGTWKNQTPQTLNAIQWQGNSTTYYLAATPYTATSYYLKPDGSIYFIYLTLGDVS